MAFHEEHPKTGQAPATPIRSPSNAIATCGVLKGKTSWLPVKQKAKVSEGPNPNTVNEHGYGNAKEAVFRINVWDDHVKLVQARRDQPTESHLRELIADGDLRRLSQRQRRT